MSITHIAPDIDYLFPATASTAKVLCGRLAQEVFDSGEFVGIWGNLNEKCAVCSECFRSLGQEEEV